MSEHADSARTDDRHQIWPFHPSDVEGEPGLVLLVEDDDASREALAFALEDRGVRVKAAATVDEALESLDREPRCVVVSDIEMPERDGFDLIRELRARDALHRRRTPAIAVTGLTTENDIGAVRSAGFDDHLAKPVDFDRLVARILTYLAQG